MTFKVGAFAVFYQDVCCQDMPTLVKTIRDKHQLLVCC